MTDTVPLLRGPRDIYAGGVEREDVRWAGVRAAFRAAFGEDAHFIARAPGRVNLIGEHVDFAGYSVLPMAIDKDILMAARAHAAPAADEVHVELTNAAARFAPTAFTCRLGDASSVQLTHEGPTRWANYFKVALLGLRERLVALQVRGARIHIHVAGSVPPESSLSSSAAMTICSSLVLVQALGVRERISRTDLTATAIESERLVGVNSGGMDQAVSVFGVPEHAVYVSFVPGLATEPIRLPSAATPHVFVVSNTLVASDKKVNGPVQYNLRVAETRLAAAALRRALGVSGNPAGLPRMYHDTLRAVADQSGAALDEVAALIEDRMPETLTRADAEAMTGMTGAAFEDTFFGGFAVHADTFSLRARARHVFREALRVRRFRDECVHPAPDVYARLGDLMNASHASLRSGYMCSCAELDAQVEIARRSGSLGSRLTGAGWGGCCVHLVPADRVESVLHALRTEYYGRFNLSAAQLDDALFTTQPSRGACIVID